MGEFKAAGIEEIQAKSARMTLWIESGKKRKRDSYRVTLEGKDGGLEVRFDRPASGKRQAAAHTVHALPGGEDCDCEDFHYRREGEGGRCKHLLALAYLGLIGAPPRPRRVLRDLGPPDTIRQEVMT